MLPCVRKKEIHASCYKYLFPCYTIHALDRIPFLMWFCCLLWAQLFHELKGQALGIWVLAKWSVKAPLMSSPGQGARTILHHSPPGQVEERGPDGERKKKIL